MQSFFKETELGTSPVPHPSSLSQVIETEAARPTLVDDHQLLGDVSAPSGRDYKRRPPRLIIKIQSQRNRGEISGG